MSDANVFLKARRSFSHVCEQELEKNRVWNESAFDKKMDRTPLVCSIVQRKQINLERIADMIKSFYLCILATQEENDSMLR